MTPNDVWRQWGAPPVELALVLAPALWYALGVRALWASAGRGHGVARSRVVAFGAGMAALLIALASPLDAMADALFSAHMVQHLLLILVSAPLLVAGAPVVPALWALPATRRRAAGRWWRRSRRMRLLVHSITAPGVVFLLHLVAVWFWHLPAPYDAALESAPLHALEHLSFLGTAALFWWVVAPPAGRGRAPEPARLLMIVGTLMHSGALGAVLMFASAAWYPAHAAGALAWGTTPLADQQLAGLLMWVPASLVYVGAAAWIFLHWMRRDERSTQSVAYRPVLRPMAEFEGTL